MISKNEVYINILSKNATGIYRQNGPQFTPDINSIRRILPQGFNLAGIGSVPQVPRPIAPKPTVPLVYNQPDQSQIPTVTKQTKTHPDEAIFTTEAPVATTNRTITKLTPVSTFSPESSPTHPTPTIPTTTLHASSSAISPIRTKPNASEAHPLTSFVPVIISVAVIFLTAALVAVYIFRKYLCAISQTLKKKNKIDKAKKSNQSNLSSNITSSTTAEDSRNSIGMNHWSGPMAFSNRYTSPWEREQNGHTQVSCRSFWNLVTE